MKLFIRQIYYLMVMFGFDPLKMVTLVRGLPLYYHDFKILKKQQKTSNISFPFGKPYPCWNLFSASGTAKGHYFHQDLLVARRVFLNDPDKHIDVGSRIDGFVAHVASFREINVLDIRPQASDVRNIVFTQVDLMSDIDETFTQCTDSLSSLHALEHFGLGRYGDPIKYDGYLKALSNIHKMLKKNGKLYISVPIGKQRIEFNAHRVFSLKYLLQLFRDNYEINCFSYVDDSGNLHENISLDASGLENNYSCNYGCGIFEMTKL